MGHPTPSPAPGAPPATSSGGNPNPGSSATPSPSPGPTTPNNPLTMYPGIVLTAGRDLDRIGDDLGSVVERIKPMRGAGAMHPTAAAAFDLMSASQVEHGGELANFTHLRAESTAATAHITQWADESSIVAGPGWRPGKPSKFLDGSR